MSGNAEEEQEVELEFPNLQDTEAVARFTFGRTTGRPTTDEVEFREWYQKQILFPELLRRGGISQPSGGFGIPGAGPSEQKPKKKSKGLVEQLLGGLGETVQGSLEESLGLGLGGSIAAAGGVVGTIFGVWELEKRVEGFPQFLHIISLILKTLNDLLFVGAQWLDKNGGLGILGFIGDVADVENVDDLINVIVPPEIRTIVEDVPLPKVEDRPRDILPDDPIVIDLSPKDRHIVLEMQKDSQRAWDIQFETALKDKFGRFIDPNILFKAATNPVAGIYYAAGVLKEFVRSLGRDGW